MSKTRNLADTINEIGEEVDLVLERRKREKYFEAIVLLYSLIENLLKWAVFMEITWDKTQRQPERLFPQAEFDKLGSFCRRLSFYDALNVALAINLVDFNLCRKIDKVREERNDVVHQLWIYTHRRNPRMLRKKLERLRDVSYQLARTVNKLTDEIGFSEILEFWL
jgi:hypothetical protein